MKLERMSGLFCVSARAPGRPTSAARRDCKRAPVANMRLKLELIGAPARKFIKEVLANSGPAARATLESRRHSRRRGSPRGARSFVASRLDAGQAGSPRPVRELTFGPREARVRAAVPWQERV